MRAAIWLRRVVADDGETFAMTRGSTQSSAEARAQPVAFLSHWKDGAPGETRTPNPQIRSLVLYPIELRAPSHDRTERGVR